MAAVLGLPARDLSVREDLPPAASIKTVFADRRTSGAGLSKSPRHNPQGREAPRGRRTH